MASSHWKKANTSIRNKGFTISLVVAASLGIIIALLGQERLGALVGMFGAALGFIVTLIISNRKAKVMIRILLFDYEEIERDFRLLFKDNYIQYHRKSEDKAYRYDFTGHNLSMTISPYTVSNYNYVFDRQVIKHPTTEVTLGELNAKNGAFAEKLAGLIDEMADQLVDNLAKA